MNLMEKMHTKFEHYKECPICANQNIKDKYNLKEYTICVCLNCSVLFVKEILTEDFLKHYYQELEGNFVYQDDNGNFISYYYEKIKSNIEKIKPDKGKILDIGCSSGAFLEKMEGWEKYGTEISNEFGNMAKEKVGNNIFIGSFEEYPVKSNYFDVITLQDVFDHFINPSQNLKKCYEMLKQGGLLIIKVHNISCLYAKVTGENFYALIPPSHLTYFNKKSLQYMLKRTGFKFLKSRFIGHILQLKTVFYRLARGETRNFYYKIYKFLEKNSLGRIKLYKNLNDIITVFAIKE